MSKPLPQIDPNVRIPAAVVAAGKRSEDLIRANNAPTSDTSESNAQAEPPDPAPSAAVTPSPEPPASAPPSPPDWEHRYNAMKGRHDQSAEQIRRMSQQLAETQRLLATMQAAPRQQAPAPADVRFVSPQEESEYGKEFLDVVGKRARETILPDVASLRAEIATLKQQLGGVTDAVVQSDQQKMFDMLDQSIPNWREINRNQDFLDWLNLPDAYSGAIRHQLMMSAYEANQVGRVAAFFRGYLADEAATRPAANSTQRSGARQPPRVDLATLAAPGRAKQAAVNTPPEKPIITRAQIAQFYKNITTGVYQGRDADRAAFEVELSAAMKEGRIQ